MNSAPIRNGTDMLTVGTWNRSAGIDAGPVCPACGASMKVVDHQAGNDRAWFRHLSDTDCPLVDNGRWLLESFCEERNLLECYNVLCRILQLQYLDPDEFYGSLKPQIGIDAEEAMKETLDTLGCLYGTIQGKECIPGILVDIEFQEPFVRGRVVDVPFSALIRTNLEVGMKKKSSIPMFILYQDISSATSLLNRLGVLCVYRQENRPKAEITESGWRGAIRPERPLQCARNCR